MIGGPQRSGRYGDWTPVSSGRQASDQPFFAGSHVGDRMDRLRRAIHEIRSNWERYPSYMRELRDLMGSEAVTPDAARRAQLFFDSVWDWSTPNLEDDFSALRLYTSDDGYRRIFRTINSALRSSAVADDQRLFRSAAFLVETLTIDLFHYRAIESRADNFEGVVYRGMCVDDASLGKFIDLAGATVDERYLSVPLALVSATTDIDRARDFALRESRTRAGMNPVIWRIHVAGLGPELLRIYQDLFPSVVVTSICAVPIDQVSDYPQEREVLLRGPFFQILAVSPAGGVGSGSNFHVIEAVMLNSNRDHISTIASNQDDDRRARDLFRVIVNIERSRTCAVLTKQFSTTDAETYRSRQESWQRRLERDFQR